MIATTTGAMSENPVSVNVTPNMLIGTRWNPEILSHHT